MTAQETILRACRHDTRIGADTDMGNGEIIRVCVDCWNASVQARRAARKVQLSNHWGEYRVKQAAEMRKVGAEIGQRVFYFAPSMLGAFFGGCTYHGRITRNRNDIAVVRLDAPSGGHRFTAWHVGWRAVQS